MANPKKNADPGVAHLRELGFDPTTTIPERIAKLRELRGKSEPTDLAIAQALGEVDDPAAGAMLVEMEAGASGAQRREVRRAIYRLRQHGIEVAEPEVERKVAPAPTESGLSALMSPID